MPVQAHMDDASCSRIDGDRKQHVRTDSNQILADLCMMPHFMPVQAPKADGSLVSMVHDAVNDPSTQAAFAHVMEAAATETKALTQLSGPATAPAPGVSHPLSITLTTSPPSVCLEGLIGPMQAATIVPFRG